MEEFTVCSKKNPSHTFPGSSYELRQLTCDTGSIYKTLLHQGTTIRFKAENNKLPRVAGHSLGTCRITIWEGKDERQWNSI